MADTLLDKHPGSRQYIAQLRVYGATRREIAEKLAAKFDMPSVPTTRSISNYFADDEALKRMVRELAAIRAEMSDDENVRAELPPERNIAQDDEDLLFFMDDHEAFGELVYRDDLPVAPGEGGSNWGPASPAPTAAAAAEIHPDIFAAFEADDDEFDATCEAMLPDDWDAVEPAAGAGLIKA